MAGPPGVSYHEYGTEEARLSLYPTYENLHDTKEVSVMKRTMRIMLMMLLVATLAVSLFAAGKSEEAKPARKVINLWSFTDEVP